MKAMYYQSSEVSYDKVVIDNNVLSRTYVKPDAAASCSPSEAQCYSLDDLVTKSSALRDVDIEAFRDVLEEFNFFALSIRYDDDDEQRYYEAIIEVEDRNNSNRVEYRNFPGGDEAPRAFTEAQLFLTDLADRLIKVA